MARNKEASFTLPSIDDLFSTQEMRDDEKLSKVREIPMDLIDDFPEHPFKVKDDEDMLALVESIKEVGILTPITVRKKDDDRYEIISGHRRKRACEIIGNESIRAEVVELNRDEAIIYMVDANLQRTKILPSEKAFSYKMRLEAEKRQGHRSDLTSDPVGPKLRSNELLANSVEDSITQIKRYIRLTELVSGLLDLVDEGRIGMRPAVELSYLPKNLQEELLEYIQMEDITPSHAQTISMRNLEKEKKLTKESIYAIMIQEKPNQKPKLVIQEDRIEKYFPKNLPYTEREKYIIEALKHYSRIRVKDDLER